MNIRLRINKILESGLCWQFLLFAIINIIVFLICIVVYQLLGPDAQVGLWEALRLFVDSNSIIDHTHSFTKQNISLLFLECLGTILFSGLIVSIITNFISQKVEEIKEGTVHYKLKNHIVIIGYDDIVPTVMKEIIHDSRYNSNIIVLQTHGSISEIRYTLLSKLSKVELKRIVMYNAPRQSVEELQLLNTIEAKEVYIVGDRKHNEHDAENMSTFEKLVSIHQSKAVHPPIPLTIWFDNEASYAALQLNDISTEWKKYFEFKPCNFYKHWANRILTSSHCRIDKNIIIYPKLDHDGITVNSSHHIHLIIIGMNRMGIALAKEAAHVLHFPNFDEKSGANRTRITFIDENADKEMCSFISRLSGYFKIAPAKYADLTTQPFTKFCDTYNNLNAERNFLDVQFEFIKGSVESKYVRDWICQIVDVQNAIISIAICLHDSSKNFDIAMYLPEEVYIRGRMNLNNPWDVVDSNKVVNIYVRQDKTGSLIKTFCDSAQSVEANNKKYANIYPFGMYDNGFSSDYYSNHLAMVLNYVYDYYFKCRKTLPSSVPLIPELTKIWKTLSTSEQWSNLYLADSIEFKLRSIGLNIETAQNVELTKEQIENLARTEHNRWNMEKLLLGYRPLIGKEFDLDEEQKKQAKKKIFAHHLIAPYRCLNDSDKEFDRNIIKNLPSILRMLSNARMTV